MVSFPLKSTEISVGVTVRLLALVVCVLESVCTSANASGSKNMKSKAVVSVRISNRFFL